VKKLGHGSFGQVFLMRHKELDVLFAVKQIRDSMNDQERHQLLTDLDIIRESHNPYIVQYVAPHTFVPWRLDFSHPAFSPLPVFTSIV
jgi:serine/threonine protein kinase